MIQQINLYLPEFYRKKDMLTAILMAQICGALVLVLVGVTAINLWSDYQLQVQIDGLQVSLGQETSRTAEILRTAGGRTQARGLALRVEQADTQLARQEDLLRFLTETNLGNTEGFSDYFLGLALSSAAADGLWLTDFKLSGGGAVVNLTGYALQSGLVPRFTASLSAGASKLNDRSFQVFQSSRVDDTTEMYRFMLGSTR